MKCIAFSQIQFFFQQLCIKELTLKLFNIKGNPKKLILLIINNIVILTFKI